MFKPKQKNRRRKRGGQNRRPQGGAGRPISDFEEDAFLLKAEIGSLEDLLADLESTPTSRDRILSRQDILPPPEPRLAHHSPAISRHTNEPNSKGLVQFVILLVIALALIFWLFYTGG